MVAHEVANFAAKQRMTRTWLDDFPSLLLTCKQI